MTLRAAASGVITVLYVGRHIRLHSSLSAILSNLLPSRFAAGLAVGMAFPISPLYVSENGPRASLGDTYDVQQLRGHECDELLFIRRLSLSWGFRARPWNFSRPEYMDL